MSSVHAFGVDHPRATPRFELRQSRYEALAQDVSDWAAAATSAPLRVLIIGCGSGNELRHLQVKPHFDRLVVSGTNLDQQFAKYTKWQSMVQIVIGDLTEGYPELHSDQYDVVICEQVLEHLERLPTAIATLERVLKPGGKLIVGVPIFPPPLHMVRKHVVPVVDRWVGRRKKRGHVQAFSLGSFVREMRKHSHLRVVAVRGFRIVSGGPLRFLENRRWWWRFNRRLGAALPAACIEIQAIMEKPQENGLPSAGLGPDARR